MKITTTAHGSNGSTASRTAVNEAGGASIKAVFADGCTASVEITVSTDGSVWAVLTRDDGSMNNWSSHLRRRVFDAQAGN